MSFRGKILLVLVSFAISLYAIFGGVIRNWSPAFAQQPINDAGAQIRIFESVLQHIQNDYVDEPNLEKVRAGALRGLAYGLDPYSSYLTAEQVKDFQAKKQNTLTGIGAEFSQVSSYLYVISVIKDSPADKAGLKSGDVIEYIENKATRDISLYDARQLLLGATGSKVNLRVLRTGAKPQTITVSRGPYKIPEAEAKIEEGKIGVIRVFSLEKGEAGDIRNRLQDLSKQGVQKIILDLRGVAAGDLNEAVDVANLFIKEGNLAQVIGRDNKVLKTFTANSTKHIFDGKVVALIDLGTSGAAEVIASAIFDRQRGEVIGERSFGAGTEQQLFTLRSGDGLLLTTAKWASATGKTFLNDERANSGVKPSIEVKRPETPEPLEVEDLVDQQERENQEPQPNQQATPTPTPKVEQPKQSQVDLQMNKALEILRDKAQAAKAGSE
ncbi:MAG: PDZ domain-containing protein [Acidobacteria bacterium]|nr:PDZ domain-containing protein [Acidobacteriota bacterium]MCA1639844.1 PDZ domain-containing protein [Acidobacteriota bacterium]